MADPARATCARPPRRWNFEMVGAVGIEPTTPSMSPRCSTAELSARPVH
jgi:hypothetical protein